jgi:hypothetical protein
VDGCPCWKTIRWQPATVVSTDMSIPSANPAVNRRETQARLRAVEEQLDKLVQMGMGGGAVQAAPLPTPTAEDAWDLAETLARAGAEGLPHGSHVETMALDTTSPLQRPYGRTFTTVCTAVTIYPLDPMTPAEALLAGLLSTSGRLNHVAYEAAVKATPGVIEGKLLGPRDLMLARQEAARAKYPRLWSA